MILDDTFAIIKSKSDLNKMAIESLYLSNFFNVIKLSNSSVGACMNYHKFRSNEDIMKTRNMLAERRKSDPLLLDYLFKQKNVSLLALNLKTCLLNALSKDLILNSSEFNIGVEQNISIFSNINSAVVIGFGGYMDFIISNTKIKNVHISDLNYDARKTHMDGMVLRYQKLHPNKKISISNGSDNKKKLGDAELVSITGSAFCNGTMDGLLKFSKNCERIIIQGQSAFIYPEVLFEKNVSLICTTIKPRNLLEIALENFSNFCRLLEGNLPKIYIMPKRNRIML